jgi:hypothetical protein
LFGFVIYAQLAAEIEQKGTSRVALTTTRKATRKGPKETGDERGGGEKKRMRQGVAK